MPTLTLTEALNPQTKIHVVRSAIVAVVDLTKNDTLEANSQVILRGRASFFVIESPEYILDPGPNSY